MNINQNVRNIQRRSYQYNQLYKILSHHQSLHPKRQRAYSPNKRYQRYYKRHHYELRDHSFYDKKIHDIQIQLPRPLFQTSKKRMIQSEKRFQTRGAARQVPSFR